MILPNALMFKQAPLCRPSDRRPPGPTDPWQLYQKTPGFSPAVAYSSNRDRRTAPAMDRKAVYSVPCGFPDSLCHQQIALILDTESVFCQMEAAVQVDDGPADVAVRRVSGHR